MSNPSNDQNVASLMARVAADSPDQLALVFQQNGREESVSFGELWRRAGAFGVGLQQAGFRSGDRAIIMVPMSIDLYVSLLAVIKIGGVAVFVDPWIGAKQIAQFADFADPTAYIGIGKSHLLRLFRSRLRGIKISVTTGRAWFGIPARYTFGQMLRHDADLVAAAVDQDDSALITFTSGSSGEPKGANRTHRFLAAQHHALAQEFPYRSDDVDMPMFPVFALNNLVSGLTSIVPEMDFRKVSEVDGRLIAGQMARHGVTTVTASPPLIDRVAPFLNSHERPISLRRILTGGAPVTDKQLEHWVEHYRGTELVVAYGSTEAEPVGHIEASERIALSSPGHGFCTGKPTDQIQAKIIPISKGRVDLSQTSLRELELPVGEIGELIVAGDHVCRDYYKNENATRDNKFVDAQGTLWHRMGDTGYFDDQQRFWLVGRVHSTINSESGWVHPQLVEQRVRACTERIAQVAAIGRSGEGGQNECLVVALFAPDLSASEKANLEVEIKSALEAKGVSCDEILWASKPFPLDPRHRSKIDYGKLKETLFA